MATAFKDWCRSESLETSGELDQLKGTRIAVDAEDYLNTLVSTTTREPLLPALGGLPFGLQSQIDNDLQHFKNFGIEVIFVFNGLDVAARDRRSVSREALKASKVLDEAWSIYDQGRGDDAVAKFGQVGEGIYRTEHIVRWMHAYLHKSGSQVQTAPYTAAAQIVQLEKDSFVHAAVGSASLFVFGADRIITSFEWESGHFLWVELNSCLGKTMLPKDQFADLMLLSGCSFIPAIPEAEVDFGASKISAARSLMSRAGHDGHTACLQGKDEDYLAAFRKAKYVIKHIVVMNADGVLEPKDAETLPTDTHDFVGQRLPDEVYFYLTRGVVGPRVLNWRTRLQIFETPPLDGGSSAAYRELVQQKLRPLHAQALALLTRPLHRYYLNTDVDLTCWFSESEKTAIGIRQRSDVLGDATISADSWRVKEANLPTHDDSAPFRPLTFALTALLDDEAARKTVTAKPEGSKNLLQTHKELLCNSSFRFLQDRGYINPDHTLSAWGHVLKTALDHFQHSAAPQSGPSQFETEIEEALLVAFELQKLDVLTSRKLFQTPPYSGEPTRGSETDKAHTLLISRVASLALFRHKAIGYTGPLSRHLLAYHQMAAAVRSSLRDLAEVHAGYMLLSGAVDRNLSKKQLTDLGASLPFVREPDLGLGLLVKSHLHERLIGASKRNDISKWFNQTTDIQGDLEKAWALWRAINAGIQAAESSIINAQVKKTFKLADDWLKTTLEQQDP